MSRYFMSGTPLEGLERMMIDSSRRVRDDGQTGRQKTEKVPPIHQLVEEVKVLDKDRILVRFKGGAEVEQTLARQEAAA